MTNRLANPQPQFFDDSGNPLAGGKLYSYVTNTSTLASTYSDSTLTTPNSNPITLDSAGRSPTDIFLDPAVTYRFVLKNSTESQTFWTKDKVADPAASVAAAVQVYNGDPNGFVAGNAGTVGGSGASLVYDVTNERLYVCITTGNAAAAVWQYIYDPISGQEDVRTGDYTITAANRGRTQVANKASAITFTLPAVATTGAGFVVPVKNIGAGALTIDGNAAETIDGATTITLGQYESCVIYCNGATWRTLGRTTLSVDYQVFTASGTWTKPTGVRASSRVLVEAWGAGGGGGANANGGGGGGGGTTGGGVWFLASDLGATVSVTVPAGGAVNTAGGNATFGSHVTAYGGGAGANNNPGGGGGGGSPASAGANASTSNGGAGGTFGGAAGSPDAAANAFAGGGGGTTGGNGGQSIWGGGGGGGGSGINGSLGGASLWGGGGGGGQASGSGGTGGASVYGGAGGNQGVAGSAPGGGGGRNAAGARGEVRVTTFI